MGHLQCGSCSEGAGHLSNWLRKDALLALHQLKSFLDATVPFWELPLE